VFNSPYEIEIELRLTSSQHLLGDFEVNGQEGVFLIDTGASNSCMDEGLAKQFSLSIAGDPQPMTGAGNEKLSAQASNKSSLSYKSQVLAQLEFMLIDMQPINTAFKEQGESPIDGIIGADLLQQHNGVIDYARRSLKLKV